MTKIKLPEICYFSVVVVEPILTVIQGGSKITEWLALHEIIVTSIKDFSRIEKKKKILLKTY